MKFAGTDAAFFAIMQKALRVKRMLMIYLLELIRKSPAVVSQCLQKRLSEQLFFAFSKSVIGAYLSFYSIQHGSLEVLEKYV